MPIYYESHHQIDIDQQDLAKFLYSKFNSYDQTMHNSLNTDKNVPQNTV